VSEFRVKKGLSQITGGLETLVKAAEMHQYLCRRVRVRNKYVRMFDDGCHPEGSDVLRFGTDQSESIDAGRQT
jgi:hypothetical protein